MILAACASGLSSEFRGTGFHAATAEEALRALHSAGLWIGPRDALEENSDYRQIIPYVVLRCGDDFIRYTRTPAGGETRLHGQMSIGLGGHIDMPDVVCTGQSIDLEATIVQASERELQEELGEIDVARREWIGVLTDDGTDVGRVHIGVVAVWHLLTPPAGLTEDAIGEVSLCSLIDLQGAADGLEAWSAMLLPHFSATAQNREIAYG